MEIIRIPSSYFTQLEYLEDNDFNYVMKTIFQLCSWLDIKVEKSLRGWIVISIYREAVQMENKARAKKWKKRLKVDVATLMGDSDNSRIVRPSKVTSSNIKENKITSKKEKESKVVVENNDTKKTGKPKEKDNSEELSTKVDEVKEFWKKDINDMQDVIKAEVVSLGLIYKSWRYERNRIRNILTSKEFWKTCELANMDRQQFVLQIIRLSWKLDFWKWKIYNAETFYKHYASVYNEARRLKTEKENNILSI